MFLVDSKGYLLFVISEPSILFFITLRIVRRDGSLWEPLFTKLSLSGIKKLAPYVWRGGDVRASGELTLDPATLVTIFVYRFVV